MPLSSLPFLDGRRGCISAIVSGNGTGWAMLATPHPKHTHNQGRAARCEGGGLEAFGLGPEISEISRRRALSQTSVPAYPRLDENAGTDHSQESW